MKKLIKRLKNVLLGVHTVFLMIEKKIKRRLFLKYVVKIILVLCVQTNKN